MNDIMMFETIITYISVPILKQVDGIILNVDHTITRPEKNCWPNSGKQHATITLIIVLPISGLNRPFCTQRKYLTL